MDAELKQLILDLGTPTDRLNMLSSILADLTENPDYDTLQAEALAAVVEEIALDVRNRYADLSFRIIELEAEATV